MTEIPWQDTGQFREACRALASVDKARPEAFGQIRRTCEKISRLAAGLDSDMTAMCKTTCPECTDNCCARATVWYDFKDLLFLYFSGRPLPDRQITRPVRGGVPACTHLTSAGCCLPRIQRPFICTWYLCDAQKNFPGADLVQRGILKVKILRREMERLFLDSCL